MTSKKDRMTSEHSDIVYQNCLRQVLENGNTRPDGTISLFGMQMRFDISNSVPVLTTKKMAWKTCLKELLWFLRGDTDTSKLGAKIWDANTTREYLDKRGLQDLPEGDIGAGYGFQWRHFGAEYRDCKTQYGPDEGVDQVQYILNQLRNDPYSRRILMSSWNPASLPRMALPPCHVSAQFYVGEGRTLSCHMYQRSVDCFLGLPFNIMSYSVLTCIFARMCGMTPKELIISTGDTHIYNQHISQVKEQLAKEPFASPKLHMKFDENASVEDLRLDDFDLEGYVHHGAMPAPIVV